MICTHTEFDRQAAGHATGTDCALCMANRIAELEALLKRIGGIPLCYDSITTGCQGRQVHELVSKLEL